jgi:hypothetical protein
MRGCSLAQRGMKIDQSAPSQPMFRLVEAEVQPCPRLVSQPCSTLRLYAMLTRSFSWIDVAYM